MLVHHESPSRRVIAALISTALAIGLSLLAGPAATAATTWQPAQNLSEQSYLMMSNRLAVSEDGATITTAWAQNSTYSLEGATLISRTSHDGGKSWDAQVPVTSLTRGIVQHEIAASSDGKHVVLVWAEFMERAGTGAPRDPVPDALVARTAFSHDAGATWSAPQSLTSTDIDAYDVHLTASADGRTVTAGWTENIDQASILQARTSFDAGATWEQARRVSGDEAYVANPRIASSSDGQRVTATWSGFFEGDAAEAVRVSSSFDAGLTWTPVVSLSAADMEAGLPVVASSGDGRGLLLAWVAGHRADKAYTQLQIATSTDGGGSWTPARTIAEGEYIVWPDAVASASGSKLTLAWNVLKDNKWWIALSSSADGGQTWSTPTTLADPQLSSVQPDLASSGDGQRVTATWFSYERTPLAPLKIQSRAARTPGRVQSTSTTDGGSTWEPISTLSNPAEYAVPAQVQTSRDGTTTVAGWTTGMQGEEPDGSDSTPGYAQVAVGTSPLPPEPPTVRKVQKPRDARGKAPKRIDTDGTTVITGKNARTNANQLITTRVRCIPLRPTTAGETRYCSINRGPNSKVTLRTYGKPMKVIVVQSAPPTTTYQRYLKRSIYLNGKRR